MRHHDDDPGLPIPFGPVSNGEYDPPPLTELERAAQRRALAECDENARRLGVSRRQFLLSICGAATTLLAIQACSDDKSKGRAGGKFNLPTTSALDENAARSRLAGDEVIFDVQTHLLDYDTIDPAHRCLSGWRPGSRNSAARTRPSRATATTRGTCSSCCSCRATRRWRSSPRSRSSAMAVRSRPRSWPRRDASPKRCATTTVCCCTGRSRPAPVVPKRCSTRWTRCWPRIPSSRGRCTRTRAGRAGGLDDHEADAPQVGEAFIRKAVETKVPRIAVHKGFGLVGGDQADYASPVDIGPAAKTHTDVDFIVYHSGYESGGNEGPYVESANPQGVDRLIASLQKSGIGPGQNVYAELGSTWFSVMRNPNQAAHVLGKLLKHVGEDRVVWGTDTLWYGSPQSQIQALRAFEITPEFQERFGYPELTPAIKKKIFGGNSMQLYGVKPIETKCEFTRDELEQVRKDRPGGNAAPGPKTAQEAAAVRAGDWAWQIS